MSCGVHRNPDNAVIMSKRFNVGDFLSGAGPQFEPMLVCHIIRCRDCGKTLIEGANFVPAIELPRTDAGST